MHWLDFREQVLKTPHQNTRQRSTLENLCLFAVNKGLENGDISEEKVNALPPKVANYLQTPKTPETPNQILEAFNDWVRFNIPESTQASSSSSASVLTI